MDSLYERYLKMKEGSTTTEPSSSLYEEYLRRKEGRKKEPLITDPKAIFLQSVGDSDKIGKYKSVMENDDFAEMSQYKPKNQNWFQKRLGNNALDVLSMNINGENLGQTVSEGIETGYLTDNEKALFNYFYNTGDSGAAYDLFESLRDDAYKRNIQYQNDKATNRIDNYGRLSAESLASIPVSIYGGASQAVTGASGALLGALSGEGAAAGWNKAALYNPYSALSESIRTASANKIAYDTGSDTVAPMAYQA